MDGNYTLVTQLQNDLVRSFAARALAVRKVISNSGGKTPGVDKVVWNSASQVKDAIKQLKNLSSYQPKPVKRVYIPKADGSMRPLGIPTMFDRAVQALFNMALVPIAECTADDRSYGYRKYRSVQDAMIYLKLVLGARYGSRWVLEADISKFFDNLSHDWLLKNIPLDKVILSKMLKAGFLDQGSFNPTEIGTPQGGLISPTIANMALDGLQQALGDNFRVVRYADDFVVIAKTKDALKDTALPIIEKFLAERGLTLKWEKTQIVSIDKGFDFLGFNFREYADAGRAVGYKKGIFLVKPAVKKIAALKEKIKAIIKNHRSLPMYVLVSKLNMLLRGWATHYRAVTSKKVFSAIGQYVFKCIWTMLCKKHPNMPKRILKQKYFTTRGGNNWVLFGLDPKGQTITLFQMGWVPIVRHTICLALNYFLPENQDYFSKRELKLAKSSCQLNANQAKLAVKQKGLCPVCGGTLLNGESLEVHHVVARKDGGSDKLSNLRLLHKLCHNQVTYCTDHIIRAALIEKGVIKRPTH
jgi:RNA-directed DNA polymerase